MKECKVCCRHHEDNKPCPTRVANAYMMLPHSLEQLTIADKLWIASHKISVLDVLEEELSSMMLP